MPSLSPEQSVQLIDYLQGMRLPLLSSIGPDFYVDCYKIPDDWRVSGAVLNAAVDGAIGGLEKGAGVPSEDWSQR